MTYQLAFLKLSNIHWIVQPASLSLCLGNLCTLNSVVFKEFAVLKTGQEPASQTSAAAFPVSAILLGASAGVPSLVRR